MLSAEFPNLVLSCLQNNKPSLSASTLWNRWGNVRFSDITVKRLDFLVTHHFTSISPWHQLPPTRIQLGAVQTCQGFDCISSTRWCKHGGTWTLRVLIICSAVLPQLTAQSNLALRCHELGCLLDYSFFVVVVKNYSVELKQFLTYPCTCRQAHWALSSDSLLIPWLCLSS